MCFKAINDSRQNKLTIPGLFLSQLGLIAALIFFCKAENIRLPENAALPIFNLLLKILFSAI